MASDNILKKSILAVSIVAALGLFSGCNDDSASATITDDSSDVAGDDGTGAGNDGDSNNDSGSGDDVTPTSVGGTAAKGLVDKGIITAYELASNGERIRTLGSTLSSNGAYSITIPAAYAGGPVLLSLTAAADTTMICDVQTACNNYLGRRNDNQYGQSVRVDPNLEMYAVIPQVQGNVINATSITPLTHMAAARALNEGTVDNLSVDRANREVSLILGRDILSAPFVDVTKADALITASSDQVLHAAFVAGTARFIFGHGRNGAGVAGNPNQLLDIQEGLNLLAEAFKDGRFDADDAARGAGFKEILEDIRTEAREAGLLTSTVGSQINAVRAQIGIDNIWTPDLSLNPDAALQKGRDVVAAQEFVGDLEQWVIKIGQADDDFRAWRDGPTGFLNARRAYNQNFAEMVVGPNPSNYRNIIEHIVDYIENTPVRSASIAGVFTRIVQITDPGGAAIGSVEIKISQNDVGGLSFSIKDKSWNAATNGLKVDLSIKTDLPIEMLDPLNPERTLTIPGAKLEISGEIQNGNGSSTLKLTNLVYEYALNPANVLIDVAPNRPLDALRELLQRPLNAGSELDTNVDIKTAMYKGGVVMTQIVNDDLIVGKTVTYTYDSNVDVELVKLNAGIANPSGRQTSLKKADFSGEVSDSIGRKVKIERKLGIGNAADFDTLDYRTANPLAALSFPALNSLRPTRPRANVRLIDEALLGPDESEISYLDGRLEAVRDLEINDESTNFGILNAKASSVFDRTSFKTATSDIVLISDNNTLSFRGDLVRGAGGGWDFKRAAANLPGTTQLQLGSTYEIQNAEGVKLSLTEVAGTNNAGDPELKIQGNITVDGRQVAIIQEQAGGPGNFSIIYEDGENDQIRVRAATRITGRDHYDTPIDLREITDLIQDLLLNLLGNQRPRT